MIAIVSACTASLRKAGVLELLMLPILILTPAASAIAQTSVGPPAPASPPAQSVEDWRAGMRRVPLPHTGCFTSSYPSGQWQEVPCMSRPPIPFLPARGPRPATVGNGNDVSVQVSGLISTTVGSFDSVSGVTSETGTNPYTGQTNDPNVYTLQLNSNFFTGSPACSGGSCLAWEQFVYESNETFPGAFMQYWLINYSGTCPEAWSTYGGDCYTNGSNSISVPQEAISNLINLSVTAEAVPGGMDTMIVSTGSTLYAFQNPDSMVDLAAGWTASEFNIVGDGNGTEASFNSGSSIVVRISVDSGTRSAPSCLGEGFTGETNDLSFASAPIAQLGTSPAIVFAESSSGSAASACASATEVASGWLTDSHDFFGIGKSGILWQATSGEVAIWEMNGTTILNPSSAYVSTVSPSTWAIVGQCDFNGDGKADLLWRNTSGVVAIWEMNGTTILNPSSAYVSTVSPSTWAIKGVGDFFGTGYCGILWQDTSGDIAIWEMNGTTILNPSSAYVATVSPSSWAIKGVGDFFGIGKAGILWQDTSGDIAIWEMNGTTILNPSSAYVSTVSPSTWAIKGVGDFFGIGKSGILWQATSGEVAIWEMNGTTISNPSSAYVATVLPSTWSIVQTGDFFGIGKSGILWQATSGEVAIWEMNGTTISNPSSAYVATVSPSTWSIQTLNSEW
jgi:hypothetical protein